MKKFLLFYIVLASLIFINCSETKSLVKKDDVSSSSLNKKQVKELRKKYDKYLVESKINETFLYSKSERKAAGLPPNKYFEQEWLLSMNPSLGRPTTENISVIRDELERSRQEDFALGRVPGDGSDNNWVERGPNNVGGRTKALIFDPTDASGNAVIAGGVSGGLWRNSNITSAATVWTRISTLPEHLNVQNITVDPNNSSTWYVGTGESYTGDVNGNGVWKTTDAGLTWTRIFGGGVVSSTQNFVYNLNIFAPSNPAVIGGYSTGVASFGDPVGDLGGNKEIVLVNDGVAPNDDACTALTAGSLTNKIALIRRGSCTFESKALAAQNAGAVGVIIMNNVAGGGVVGMASSDLGATVPTLSISKEDGDLLVANLTNLTGNFSQILPGQFSGIAVSGVQNINDVAIKNVGGVSNIYIAVGDSYNAGYIGTSTIGLYKSVDGGANWVGPLSLPVSASGNKTCPFDIEIAVGGTIWVSSTDSRTFGDGGGNIFSSTDNGTTWVLKHTVVGNGGGKRVEIEASETTADVLYVCSQLGQASATAAIEVQLLKTLDGFTTAPSILNLPTGDEGREATYGFTGAQAFYDMMIESSPTNDAILYVGGIDLYRSANSGTSWTTISNWMTDVHSDQHAMTFKPGNPNIGIFGNDGGVYYSGSLSTTGTPATSRNAGFNVTQFVGVAVSPTGVSGLTGDFFVAGAQDNGSNYFPSSRSTTTGVASGVLSGSYEVQGGDGGIPLFKQNATNSSTSYYITNYVYNDNMNKRGLNGSVQKTLNDATSERGLFYPAMTLDSQNNIVYSDFTDTTNRVYTIRRYSNLLGATITRTNFTYPTLLNSFPTALSVGKSTPSTLYVGTSNSKLLKLVSANTVTAAASTAGTGWSDISLNSGFVGTISDIEFGANDSQIFVTLKNYGTTNVWYTPNGGTNWYSIEGNLPDLPIHAILQNPLAPSEIIVGTELGVWYTNTFNAASTSNQSLNWAQAYNGMSGVKVTDLDLQPNSPTAPTAYNVFAATYGRGVFSGMFTNVVLGNNSFESLNNVTIYPNPVKDNLNIKINNFSGDLNATIVDINGKIVLNTKISDFNSTNSINVSSLSKGVYVLTLEGGNFNHSEKIILE